MPADFTIIHRVQFAETDLAGIMHFSNFFKMMEEVEHAFFRSVGLSVSMQHDDIHIGWPRVSASCEYFGPLRFEDEVELMMRVTKVGEKSFNYEVEFIREGRRVALGKMTSVCCEMLEQGMVGDEAHVQPGGKVVDVTGNVRLQGDAAGREGAAIIHTDTLSYNVPDAVASTKSDVRIDFEQHSLTAHGMSANLKERTMRLESKVNGRFHP